MNQRPAQLADDIEPKPQSSGGWKALVPIVAAVAISFLAVMFFLKPVSTDDYNKNAQAIASDINGLKTGQASLQSSVNQLAGMTSQINQINSSVAEIRNGLSKYATQDSVTSGINSLKSSISDATGNAATAQVAVSKLATSVDTLITQVNAVKTQLAQVSNNVTQLQQGTGTTTTSGSTPVASGQVGVTLMGNPFTGSQTIAFGAISANTSVSQSFSFQIVNNTGKPITNIQLVIGLELVDANNNVMTAGLPATTTVALTSTSLMTVWTQGSTGVSYILGFTNNSPTGIFGGIGTLSQGTGSSTYTFTVTVTNGATATNPFNIYPMVKVTSYS